MTNLEIAYRKELKSRLGLNRMYRGGYKALESTLSASFARLTVACSTFNNEVRKSFNRLYKLAKYKK